MVKIICLNEKLNFLVGLGSGLPVLDQAFQARPDPTFEQV